MAAQPLKPEKACNLVPIRLPDTLLADLKTYAAQQGYDSLSPVIRQILRQHMYGHVTPNRDLLSAGVSNE